MNPFLIRRGSGRPQVTAALLFACSVIGLFGICLWSAVRAGSASVSAATPADLGERIFYDTSLSASGQMACATCHDPAQAHAQSNDLPVQYGGANLDVPGFRAVPSLRYMNFNVPFFFQNDGTPTGGFNRDGRAKDLVDQAHRPLLAPHEMADADAADVAGKLSKASYAADFRAVYGDNVFDDPDLALLAAEYSLATFEQSAREFHPYDSKFDDFLKGQVMLSAQELRGFVLFNREDKGNCAACHPSTRQSDGSPPAFTDYTYDSLGVPRNPDIPANDDPDYYDLGLCGPFRTDLAKRLDLCGLFKVPTLRNVATRHVFFHNGYFHDLTEALHFYVQRDTDSQMWYPLDVNGVPDKFNDIPSLLRRNVNTEEVPYDRHPGQAPRLNDAEIDDLVAFLKTLTDGYDPLTDSADPARDVPAPPTN
ncbi:MAG: cytochrome c peroxidase [Rudaea sp.]